jgi:hypothetical protein
MTDNEIIKAWEKVLATGDAPIGVHWQCWVSTKLAKETFDMLNRQKAEIDELKTKLREFVEKLRGICEEGKDG